MTNSKEFEPQHAALTPAQLELIDFCCHLDIPSIVEAVETTLKQAAFFNKEDITPLMAEKFQHTDYLLEILKRIQSEGSSPLLATA